MSRSLNVTSPRPHLAPTQAIVEREVKILFPLFDEEIESLELTSTEHCEEAYRNLLRNTVFHGQRVAYESFEVREAVAEEPLSGEDCPSLAKDRLSLSEEVKVTTANGWCSVLAKAKALVSQHLSEEAIAEEVLASLLVYLSRPPLTVKVEVFGAITSKRRVEDDPQKNFLLGRGRALPIEGRRDERLFALVISCSGRQIKLTDDDFTLRWAAIHRRLALVTGTGLSKSLTQNHLSLWDDLLVHLRAKIWPQRNLGSLDLTLFHSLQGDPHAQSEYLHVCAERDGRSHALVSEILQVVCQLVPTATAREIWREALSDFTGPILTFNYDIALEIATGRLPIDARDERALKGLCDDTTADNRGSVHESVIHLHGIYTHDQSIVLRQQTYLDVVQPVCTTFVTLAEQGFVFLNVGIKGVLTDPDLSPYWRWEDIRHAIRDRRPCRKTHFVVCREDEILPFPRRSDFQTEYPFFRKISVSNYDEIPKIVKEILSGQFCESTNKSNV